MSASQENGPVNVHGNGTHALVRFPKHLGGGLGWDKIEGNSIPPEIFPSEAKAREELMAMEDEAKRTGEYHPPISNLEFPPASAEGLVSSVAVELEDVSALLETEEV